MNKINMFFLAGTLGILFTAMANILLQAIAPDAALSFSIFYPFFALILVFGTGVMIKKKDTEKK